MSRVAKYPVLRFEMLKAGLTIADIAECCGIHRTTMAKKLCGDTAMTVGEIARIRERFFPELSLDILSSDKYADSKIFDVQRGKKA